MEILRKGPEPSPKYLSPCRCECPHCGSLLEYTSKDVEITGWFDGIFWHRTPILRCLHCFETFTRRWYHRLWDSLRPIGDAF